MNVPKLLLVASRIVNVYTPAQLNANEGLELDVLLVKLDEQLGVCTVKLYGEMPAVMLKLAVPKLLRQVMDEEAFTIACGNKRPAKPSRSIVASTHRFISL
ncbi:MAG: hypothetical protein ACXVI9_00200 [Mucilaginibacter sp.]